MGEHRDGGKGSNDKRSVVVTERVVRMNGIRAGILLGRGKRKVW